MHSLTHRVLDPRLASYFSSRWNQAKSLITTLCTSHALTLINGVRSAGQTAELDPDVKSAMVNDMLSHSPSVDTKLRLQTRILLSAKSFFLMCRPGQVSPLVILEGIDPMAKAVDLCRYFQLFTVKVCSHMTLSHTRTHTSLTRTHHTHDALTQHPETTAWCWWAADNLVFVSTSVLVEKYFSHMKQTHTGSRQGMSPQFVVASNIVKNEVGLNPTQRELTEFCVNPIVQACTRRGNKNPYWTNKVHTVVDTDVAEIETGEALINLLNTPTTAVPALHNRPPGWSARDCRFGRCVAGDGTLKNNGWPKKGRCDSMTTFTTRNQDKNVLVTHAAASATTRTIADRLSVDPELIWVRNACVLCVSVRTHDITFTQHSTLTPLTQITHSDKQ